MKLFSYVVHHDYGLSPNPAGGYCTLAFCKFSQTGVRPNVVELAREGDWVIGTGGASRLSAGRGKLVYAMQVTEKLPLREFLADRRFRTRDGNGLDRSRLRQRLALVSDRFFYFGANAPALAPRHVAHPDHPIEQPGQGFRNRFDPAFVADFERWLLDVAGRVQPLATGIYGLPSAAADPRWVRAFAADPARPTRNCRRTAGC